MVASEGHGRRTVSWGQPGQHSKRPYFKEKKKKNYTGGMVQVVEGLNTKHKALSSTPSTGKKKWVIQL
jgi:hypothetical protein